MMVTNKQYKDLLQAVIELRDAERKCKQAYSTYNYAKVMSAQKKVDKLINESQHVLEIKGATDQTRINLFS